MTASVLGEGGAGGAVDVLLTHGFYVLEDPKEREIMKPYPPLGLLYIHAYLTRAGLRAEVHDVTYKTKDDTLARLRSGPPSVLGIYTTHMVRRHVTWIMREAKALGWTIVIGGPDGDNCAREYLEHGADVVGVGEGEQLMLELLAALQERGKHRLHDVAGIHFRDETGAMVTTPARERLPIASLPWPSRDAVDLRQYLDSWKQRHGENSLNIITARGCPYTCKWCSHGVFGRSYRHREVEDVVDEVQHLIATYNPDQLWFADDVFTMNHPWLRKLHAELVRRNIRIRFETISRADRMMDEDLITLLAQLGCTRLWIGSESGSDRVLKAMDRRVTADQVQWVVERAKKAGIEIGMFLMWGYDGESLEDIEDTIEHVKRTDPDIFFTTVAYPIRKTPYALDMAGKVRYAEDWANSSDKDCVIPGRRVPEFYKNADQWLRSAVEAHRLAPRDAAASEESQRKAVAARERVLSRIFLTKFRNCDVAIKRRELLNLSPPLELRRISQLTRDARYAIKSEHNLGKTVASSAGRSGHDHRAREHAARAKRRFYSRGVMARRAGQ
jgi:anaerobic magnesium-protoporphyrin IX monomethyl ester cyclase